MKKGGSARIPPFSISLCANMSYCGERSLVKYDGPARIVASQLCRAWTCPDCAPNRQKRLIAEAHAGSPNTFLTLTSRRREGLTANQAALQITRAWRLIRLRLMRQRRLKKLPFLAVMEATRNGWPHLHILLRSIWIDQKQLSAWMDELAESPIVDIRRIDNKGKVAAYVAKYVSKCAHKFGSAKRYYKSRDYDLRDPDELARFLKKQPGWEPSTVHPYRLERQFRELGWLIERQSKFRFVATPAPS